MQLFSGPLWTTNTHTHTHSFVLWLFRERQLKESFVLISRCLIRTGLQALEQSFCSAQPWWMSGRSERLPGSLRLSGDASEGTQITARLLCCPQKSSECVIAALCSWAWPEGAERHGEEVALDSRRRVRQHQHELAKGNREKDIWGRRHVQGRRHHTTSSTLFLPPPAYRFTNTAYANEPEMLLQHPSIR